MSFERARCNRSRLKKTGLPSLLLQFPAGKSPHQYLHSGSYDDNAPWAPPDEKVPRDELLMNAGSYRRADVDPVVPFSRGASKTQRRMIS